MQQGTYARSRYHEAEPNSVRGKRQSLRRSNFPDPQILMHHAPDRPPTVHRLPGTSSKRMGEATNKKTQRDCAPPQVETNLYLNYHCHSSSRHDVHSADHFVSDRVEQKAVACIVCESNKDRIHVWRIQLHSHLARQLCLIRKISPTATNTSIHRRYSLLRSSRHIFLTSSQLVFVSFHVSKSYILSFKSLHLITSRRYFLVLQNFF